MSTAGFVLSGRSLGLAELHRPTRVPILVPELGGPRLPILRNAPLLDRVFPVLRVALLGRRDQAGVDDLAGHGDVAGRPQHCIETLEQRSDRLGSRGFFPEQPDRAGVPNPIRQSEAEEAHE